MATAKKVSVASLGTPQKEGWLTKQGGSIKTWKRRWFVLKDDKIYYFKGQKDAEATGVIQLESGASAKEEPNLDRKKFFFSVKPGNDAKRVFLIQAEKAEDAKSWVQKINEVLNKSKGTGGGGGGGGTGGTTAQPTQSTPQAQPVSQTPQQPAPKKEEKMDSNAKLSARDRVALAKQEVFFLREDDSKVLEFWQIWFESIPTDEELTTLNFLDFNVSTSVKMEKLTWRTAGPQNVFIQKMVDFFWNVGAPETEIDRLNDVGTSINPLKIGSWIDMSHRGGMDGGWYFPVGISIQAALEAADAGDPVSIVAKWAEKHNVEECFSVGRDMGAAPPRQTEIRLKIPGTSATDQLRISMNAYEMFDFPPPPEEAMALLRESKPGICLSIITSCEGFVRLGVLSPDPSPDMIAKCCGVMSANKDPILKFQRSLGVDGPAFAEFQYLKEGFGYGVYPEGFDIVLHYAVGDEQV